jgi:ABC-type multidrug transport system fused ATPase/permease subunit
MTRAGSRITGYFRFDIYWRLLRYMLPYRYQMAAVVGFTIFQSLLGLLGPWPFKFLIDSGFGHKRLPGFITAVLPFLPGHRVAIAVFALLAGVLLGLLASAVGIASDYMKNSVNRGMVVDYKTDLFRHMQRLSLTYHDRHPIGDSMYRIETDTDFVSTMLWGNFRHIMTSIITFVGMLIVLLELDATLALIAVASTPLIYFLIAVTTKRFKDQSKQIKAYDAAASSIVQEVLSALKVVKAFGQEERESHRFEEQSRKTLRAKLVLQVREDAFGTGVSLIRQLNRAVVMLIAAVEVIHGHITIGEYVVIGSYVSQLHGPLATIGETLADMQMSLASAERTVEVLDHEPDVAERPDARSLGRARGGVTVDDVAFRYPDGPLVLEHVSFQAAPGEVVAIVGPTGAGKTTLANLLCRFYDPASGRIALDGQDLRDLTIQTLRDNIALVIQEPMLFSKTIAENVAYGRPDASREQVVEAATAAGAHEFITALPEGYDSATGERGMRLSGGERQRISVARAFLKDAPVLILDEPTSSVDSRTELMILDAMDRLMVGRTTFIIAHRLSTVRRADQILVLDEGHLVEQGTHDQLLSREGLYAEFFRIQSAGLRRTLDSGESSPAAANGGSHAEPHVALPR